MSTKYNRTFHFPFSEGATNDDKVAKSVDKLIGVPIVISEKLDGSNVCMEQNAFYARSHNAPPKHPSFDICKAMHAKIRTDIPEGFQLFGENVFAQHSIKYTALPSYFLLFNIRSNKDANDIYWLGWDLVEYFAEELGLHTVPVLFKGKIKSEKELQKLTLDLMKESSVCGGEREGLVVRVATRFKDEEFSECILKIVRKNHVSTDTHWTHQEVKKNGLKE
jgi:hypothetical protein